MGVGFIGVPVTEFLFGVTTYQAWMITIFWGGGISNMWVEIDQGLRWLYDKSNYADPAEWLFGLIICFVFGGLWLLVY